jgi:hypothetical protein
LDGQYFAVQRHVVGQAAYGVAVAYVEDEELDLGAEG